MGGAHCHRKRTQLLTNPLLILGLEAELFKVHTQLGNLCPVRIHAGLDGGGAVGVSITEQFHDLFRSGTNSDPCSGTNTFPAPGEHQVVSNTERLPYKSGPVISAYRLCIEARLTGPCLGGGPSWWGHGVGHLSPTIASLVARSSSCGAVPGLAGSNEDGGRPPRWDHRREDRRDNWGAFWAVADGLGS